MAVSSADALVFSVGRPDVNLKDPEGWMPQNPGFFPIITDTAGMSIASLGIYRNRFSLCSAYDGPSLGEAAQRPLVALVLPARETSSPYQHSFMEVRGAAVSVAKAAEDDSGDLILRLYDRRGKGGQVEVRWDQGLGFHRVTYADLKERAQSAPVPSSCSDRSCFILLEIGPWEVLTLRLMTSPAKGPG